VTEVVLQLLLSLVLRTLSKSATLLSLQLVLLLLMAHGFTLLRKSRQLVETVRYHKKFNYLQRSKYY
jgi:hypothetical protein